MQQRDTQPGAETPQESAVQKRAWSAPQLTILDAKETLTGPPGGIEETPLSKPGS